MVQLDKSYLTRKATLDQAVRENTHDGVPFGHANDDWQRLVAKMRSGDELWYFEPPSRDVMQLWGVALVRDGQVISTVITALT